MPLNVWLMKTGRTRGGRSSGAHLAVEEPAAEVAKVKRANAARPDEHNYSEAETRDYFIDLLLKEAGWALDQPRDREFPVEGMPNSEGEGVVDDVLRGDDGLPLALNESKRTKRDPRVGQQQAKLYADCLEKQFGQRPIIFYSNGYEHWIWDDTNYPPRPVQGFYKKKRFRVTSFGSWTWIGKSGSRARPAFTSSALRRRGNWMSYCERITRPGSNT
jgi:hypothetical protein